MVPEKTVERLILYRRNLLTFADTNAVNVFSHQLAKMSGVSSAQVRRDLMAIGYSGSPVRGYEMEPLLRSLSDFIDAQEKQGVALVGAGHIGRAILHFFQGRRPKLEIAAVFDTDPEKINRVMHGVRCYAAEHLEEVVQSLGLRVGIIAVPAGDAQEVAERMTRSGIKGILNYAPVKLSVPHNVFVENRDMTTAVEKIAYFARQQH